MTKLRIAILTSMSLLILYFTYSNVMVDSSSPKVSRSKVDVEKREVDGKKVLGLSPGKEKEQMSKLQIGNVPGENWKPNLEEALQLQGGDSIAEMKIDKVDSFVWVQDGIALHVESVIVNLKGKNKERTSFRLLVDAQNGNIIQNWDQPVYDPLFPKNEFKLKVDPVLD